MLITVIKHYSQQSFAFPLSHISSYSSTHATSILLVHSHLLIFCHWLPQPFPFHTATSSTLTSTYAHQQMRDLVNSWSFLFRKKLDDLLSTVMPKHWLPLYTMVTFTRYPYHLCIARKSWQDKVCDYISFLYLWHLWLTFSVNTLDYLIVIEMFFIPFLDPCGGWETRFKEKIYRISLAGLQDPLTYYSKCKMFYGRIFATSKSTLP